MTDEEALAAPTDPDAQALRRECVAKMRALPVRHGGRVLAMT
jgi:hypothetical protein